MREMLPNEDRHSYLLKVAAVHIKTHALYNETHYDDADCDGHCLAEELEQEAQRLDEIKVKFEKCA